MWIHLTKQTYFLFGLDLNYVSVLQTLHEYEDNFVLIQ